MRISKRYVSIEFLKAVGIMYMIALHQLAWLFIKGDTGGLRYLQAEPVARIFSRTGLHIFNAQLPLLAALVFYLYARRPEFTWMKTLQRAGWLAALEFLKNFLAWGVSDTFDWDVLPFIGLCMLVSYPFIKKIKQPYGLCLLGILGAAAVALSDRFPFSSVLGGTYLYRIIFGDITGGNYWPLFPWFSLFFAGLILGHIFTEGNMRKMKLSVCAGFFLVGVSIVSGRYLPVIDFENIWGPAMFKPSPFFIFGILGTSMVIVPLTHMFLECFPAVKRSIRSSFLMALGQGVLWIYLSTIFIGYTATGILTIVYRFTFRQSVILWPVLTGITLVLAYAIGRIAQRRRVIEYI